MKNFLIYQVILNCIYYIRWELIDLPLSFFSLQFFIFLKLLLNFLAQTDSNFYISFDLIVFIIFAWKLYHFLDFSYSLFLAIFGDLPSSFDNQIPFNYSIRLSYFNSIRVSYFITKHFVKVFELIYDFFNDVKNF